MNATQKLLRAGFRSLVRLYFRSIEVVGERPSERTGGRVFIANHSNALLEPILVLTHAPCDISPLAKSTLWKIPGLKYLLDIADAVPVLRRSDDPNKAVSANDEMFEKIAQHLARGGNVLVFPEGTSHNEPQLIRLKTGAARMLERARALGARGLTFQAVGLEFDERHAFRSRAVVAYGPVRELEAIEPERVIEDTTRTMRDDLVELVIEGKTWDERRLVLKVAELIRNEAGDVSFAEAVRLAQGVEHARDDLRLRDPELAERTETAIRAYFTALERVGATDDQIAGDGDGSGEDGSGGASFGKKTTALSWLALPLLPIGVALYYVPYQLPRLVASRTSEIDQHSTLKLATGLVAYPVWAGVLAAAAFAAFPSRRARALAIATLLASPFAALHWLERIEQLRPTLRLAKRKDVLADLRDKRSAALAAVERAREMLERQAFN